MKNTAGLIIAAGEHCNEYKILYFMTKNGGFL